MSLLVLAGFSPVIAADSEAPEPSRWRTNDGRPRPLHSPPADQGPLEIIQRSPAKALSLVPPGPSNTGRICLVVESAVYGDISTRLDRFVNDLQKVGFTVVIYQYVSGTAEDLRDYLRTLYLETESLVGVELIGDIPYIIFEMMQDWDGSGGDPAEYEDFACDIFYGDLDGTWEDVLEDGQVHASNGKYDTRSGNIDMEIWVSRLKTGNLSAIGSETAVLNGYFDKNHSYRTCTLRAEPKGLVYDDDDWSHMGGTDGVALEKVYSSSNVTVVDGEEDTTAADYTGVRLPLDQELVFTRSHGNPGSHTYYRNGGSSYDWVYVSDYVSIDPPAFFYSFYVCSGCDYTASNYLGGIAAFNPNAGLLAWGSTKTGGMSSDSYLYTELQNGGTFGDAFVAWYNQVNDYSYAPRYYLGMVLVGDGSLQPSTMRTELLLDIPASATEGDGVLAGQGTVTIPAPRESALSVSLSSSDTSEVQVPGSVTVQAGNVQASFDLTIVADGVPDADETITITASHSGWTSGTGQMIVYDADVDGIPPTVNLTDLVLSGTTSDDSGQSPLVLVDGVEATVDTGTWVSGDVAVTAPQSVPVEASDSSGNSTTITVAVGIP